MQYIPTFTFALTIVLTLVLIGLRLRIDWHRSGLESAFESNRIQAKLHIANLHTWMGVIGITLMVVFVIFMITALGNYHMAKPTAC